MMPDKEAKKKALDLMIVVGNSKPKKDMEEKGDKEDMKCECPCCGRECYYCKKENDMEDEMEDDMEEDDSDMEEDEEY